MPYVRAWAEKYKDSGLVVIGVHTPELDFEGQKPNVQKAIQKFGITYPVALDSNHAIWTAFHNEYWPAHYFIDAKGKVRYEHFGEGDYDQSGAMIQELLKEANAKSMPASTVSVHGQGVEAASDTSDVRSPETYIGYARAAHFASSGGIRAIWRISTLRQSSWIERVGPRGRMGRSWTGCRAQVRRWKECPSRSPLGTCTLSGPSWREAGSLE